MPDIGRAHCGAREVHVSISASVVITLRCERDGCNGRIVADPHEQRTGRVRYDRLAALRSGRLRSLDDGVDARRISRIAACGSAAPNTLEPAISIVAPASTARSMFVVPMPPSTSMSQSGLRAATSARTSRNFTSARSMKAWPPKPGFTLNDQDLIAFLDQVDQHRGRRLRVDPDAGAGTDLTQVLQQPMRVRRGS